MQKPIRFLILLFLGTTAGAWSQQSCRVDLPVGIVDKDGILLDGLTAQDITVHIHKQNLTIESVTTDSGSRRVLFVVDTSRLLPPEARKVGPALANYVTSNARPGDTFALLTTRGTVRRVRFADGRDAVIKAAQDLATDPKESAKAANVLDSIREGISWFGEPQPGDAIILMADHLEEADEPTRYQPRGMSGAGPMQGVATDRPVSFEAPSRAKFKDVVRSLGDHRIRVFGLQFGAFKFVPMGEPYRPNDENLFGFTLGSGGYAVLDPVDQYGSYIMNPDREKKLQHRVFQLYGAITRYYVLRVSLSAPPHGESWSLELAKDLRKNTVALYPRVFEMCTVQEMR